jgi:BolA family transcriptional regulator, general stress-responsive regulator
MKQLIENRLKTAFKLISLEVVDESDQHIGHEGYQGGGRHFAIIIKTDDLKNLSCVAAHRKIYNLFADVMPHQIHALRIKVL